MKTVVLREVRDIEAVDIFEALDHRSIFITFGGHAGALTEKVYERSKLVIRCLVKILETYVR